MKMNLCLLAINRFKGKEGEDMYKYVFASENNTPMVGYSSHVVRKEEIVDSNTFDSARARIWEVTCDVWNDKLTYRVVIPSNDSLLV